jgi:hypothetical protein
MRSHSQPKIESREVHRELQKAHRNQLDKSQNPPRRKMENLFAICFDIDLFRTAQPTTFNDALITEFFFVQKPGNFTLVKDRNAKIENGKNHLRNS